MKILQLTCHYYPNVGGVETHLKDLVKGLVKKGNEVFVLTYCPLVTKVKCKILEKENKLTILRIPWIKNYFYKLVNKPKLEFIYLFPGLFLTLPFILISGKYDVIHSHGLVAGFVGMFWGKVFGVKSIVSTHSIYSFPKRGLYPRSAKYLFDRTGHIFTLSNQSKKELISLGIKSKKITVFTYWIDLDMFKPVVNAKNILKLKNKFVVFFVGRLVEEKGITILLKSFEGWNKNITLMIAGVGPCEYLVKSYLKKFKNLKYLGNLEQKDLPLYYSAANITIVPSIHEEGFGRVILESLACETPVIGSNRGAIPEAINDSVGKLIEVSEFNIKLSIDDFYKNNTKLERLRRNCRAYAVKRYSDNNLNVFLEEYKKI